MKLTASSAYQSLIKSSGIVYSFKTYIRKVTDITLALNYGTWTEVTRYIDSSSASDYVTKIEYDIGQFSSDSHTFTGNNIAWWKANVFNATSTQYIEIKVELTIIGASDIIPVFAGWVDKIDWTADELTDQVVFNALSAEDLGQRIAAENVTVQVKNGTYGGVYLAGIPGLYVTNCNYGGKPLNVGVHTITTSANTAALDGGTGVALPGGGGSVTLYNKDSSEACVCYWVGGTSTGMANEVVIPALPTTLPRTWYRNVSARTLLAKLYAKIGLTTLNFDSLEFTTYDSAQRLFFVDECPPDRDMLWDSVSWGRRDIAVDENGWQYIAISNFIYSRDPITGLYYLILDMTAQSRAPIRLMYNARNRHLWIITDQLDLYRYDVASQTLSARVVCLVSPGYGALASFILIDYNYTGSSWKYCVAFTDENNGTNGGGFCTIDGTTLAKNTTANANPVYTGTTLGTTIKSRFMYQNAADRVRIFCNPGTCHYYEILITAAGAWTTTGGGSKVSGIPEYFTACYHASEGRVYFQDGANNRIASHTDSSATLTGVLTYGGGYIPVFFYVSTLPLMYFAVQASTYYHLYSVTANVATQLTTTNMRAITAMNYGSSRLYLIGDGLMQFSNIIMPYLVKADFTDTNVTAAIYKVLKAFNFMGTISMNKKAIAYRRSNSAGTPISTGNTVNVTAHEASAFTETTAHYPIINFVSVDNNVTTITYDGTLFDSTVLSDARQLSVSNDFIPDAILKDLCYYYYQFFKTDRNMYKIDCGIYPAFQYEPFDLCAITFTGRNMSKSGTGVIYSASYGHDLSLKLEVLL
jgi:hypothetical protein